MDDAALPVVFDDWHAELLAIAAGRKAMSAFVFGPTDSIEDPSIEEITARAVALGLMVRLSDDSESVGKVVYRWTTLLVGSRNVAWRLSAYEPVMRVLHSMAWTVKSERIQSFILGYSEAQFADWILALRSVQAGWGFQVHFWLTTRQVSELRVLGGRAIHPGMLDGGLDVCRVRWRKAMRSGAIKAMPCGIMFCRCVVAAEFYRTLFAPSSATDLGTVDWFRIEQLEAFNLALRSRIEVFGTDGWS